MPSSPAESPPGWLEGGWAGEGTGRKRVGHEMRPSGAEPAGGTGSPGLALLLLRSDFYLDDFLG